MGIGSVSAMGSASGSRAAAGQPVDTVSKSLQNEISDVQRQKQELSSKEDLSAGEKTRKKRELQQEISSLNTRLRQRQEKMRKEKQKEALKELQADKGMAASDTEKKAAGTSGAEKKENKAAGDETAKTGARDEKKKDAGKKRELENVEAGISPDRMEKFFAADNLTKQDKVQGSVIARMEGGVAILKSEIRQDETRGADSDPKREALRKQERRVRSASGFAPERRDADGRAAGRMIRTTNYAKDNG